MATTTIAVINSSTLLTDDQAKVIAPALQDQVHKDFGPVWGLDADLTFVAKGGQPPQGSWWLALLDDSDQAGALGYRDLTDEGLPMGKAFVRADLQAGTQWTVTASHELLEMLVDPDINLSAYVQKDGGSMLLYAYEVCDACEADAVGYKIGDVLVSDFVYPAWFESFRSPGSTHFDFTKQISKPFDLLPGGYISVFDTSNTAGWTQKFSENQPRKYAMRAAVGSRRERRRIPRSEWMRSELKKK